VDFPSYRTLFLSSFPDSIWYLFSEVSKGDDCDDQVVMDSTLKSGRTLPHSKTWPPFGTR